MFRRALTLCVILGFASMAHGAAVIELTALTPENGPGGVNYLGGTTVEFQAAISTDAGEVIPLRLVTLAFHDSSPELVLQSPFNWDYSTLMTAPNPGLYGENPDSPLENITNSGQSYMAGFFLEVPVGGSLVLGTMSVVLPAEEAVEVTYYVDALNADSPDEFLNDTARIDFDFVNPTTWAANGFGADLVTGDPLGLTVIPEPATLLLLGLGGVAVLRRRR